MLFPFPLFQDVTGSVSILEAAHSQLVHSTASNTAKYKSVSSTLESLKARSLAVQAAAASATSENGRLKDQIGYDEDKAKKLETAVEDLGRRNRQLTSAC